MRKLLLLFSGIFLLFSCSKKMTSNLSVIEKKLTDSLNQVYVNNGKEYVYFDSIPYYSDKTEKQIVGYLKFCTPVYIDTIFEATGEKDSIAYVKFTGIVNGTIKKGYVRQAHLSLASFRSKVDSTLIFMGNYIDGAGEFCKAEMKAVKNKSIVKQMIVADSLTEGLYMNFMSMENCAFDNVGEMMYFSTFYPACGYATDNWYLGFKNNDWIVLSHTTSWADAPFWDHTNVYLPFKTKDGVVMAMWSPYYDLSEFLVTDSNEKVITYQPEAEYQKSMTQMIYTESSRSYEKLNDNGETLMNEYDEPELGEELYEKRWLKWDGKNMVELKRDTTITLR